MRSTAGWLVMMGLAAFAQVVATAGEGDDARAGKRVRTVKKLF